MTDTPFSEESGEPASRQPVMPPAAPLVPPLPDMFVVGKEFHLKEYDSLKKELGDLVEHSRKLEIYAVAGIAAFYAWYLTVMRPSVHATRSAFQSYWYFSRA